FAPRPEARSTLLYIGAGARDISAQAPLIVTRAQGARLQFARQYRSRRQALAFEFLLDRLQAWNLIAWTRSDAHIDIVVGPNGAKLLPAPGKLAADAARGGPAAVR